MNVSIGDRWESFVEELVKSGRYSSASEVMREGLRLVEEREARLYALHQMLDEAIAEGGKQSAADVKAVVDAKLANLKKAGL